MTEVAYGRYDEAYKAIHSALNDIMAPPPGKRVTKLAFTWNADGAVDTVKVYENAELLFTLSFSWNSGALQDITRS